jgi:5-methylcytosine-specific restriction protein A
MKSPSRICTAPGCHVIVRDGSRCPKHEATKHVGTSRNRPGDPFYSSAAWIRVRNERRQLNELCQECEAMGRVTAMWAVDHILPRSTHPHLELDIENTRSLCESHHNARTARDRNTHPPGGHGEGSADLGKPLPQARTFSHVLR